VPAPLAKRQIAAIAGAELVEHIVEDGAPERRLVVYARGGEELAVRAEHHSMNRVVVGDTGKLAAVRHRHQPRRFVVARGGEVLAVRAERHC
jgi:hypothetical protein